MTDKYGVLSDTQLNWAINSTPPTSQYNHQTLYFKTWCFLFLLLNNPDNDDARHQTIHSLYRLQYDEVVKTFQTIESHKI
jgi:hypothetical protein